MSFAMATATNLCEQCHLKPKFQNYRYCGRTCGQLATHQTTPEKCDFCHTRPKRWEGTRRHDYCSKTCADKARPQQSAPPSTNARPPLANKNASASGVCEYSGCSSIVTGGARYCTQHYQQALQDAPCLLCRAVPKMPKSAFCGSPQCEQAISKSAPCIIEVPSNHPSFLSVEKQFQTSWRHGGGYCPRVRKIFKIVLKSDSLRRYDAYKADVEARGKFSLDPQRKMTEGNERRRWHGTRKDCHLGDPGHHQGPSFCASPTCSLCKIIQDSFNLDQWGKNTGWGRFGKGIYTSATSSKANDYIKNHAASDYNAILLNNVVIGRGKKLTYDNTNLMAAPATFDSVLGEKGGSLNHDEVVVYKGEAIRPSYLVVYDAV
ncbi:hypothetical protein CPB85DRAFT_263149 [Mucidula mucida]|nr:hypothetical protein CPB85DRAFT_263149 [Mucidula mucida]